MSTVTKAKDETKTTAPVQSNGAVDPMAPLPTAQSRSNIAAAAAAAAAMPPKASVATMESEMRLIVGEQVLAIASANVQLKNLSAECKALQERVIADQKLIVELKMKLDEKLFEGQSPKS